MANINLRPWREERKERLKNEFIQVTVLFAAFAGFIWFGWNRIVAANISDQNSRNNELKKEIASLDKKVQEINELKKKKQDLVERMKVIQGLQGTRPMIVHLFDDLSKTIPDGVFFTKITRKETKLFINGTSESNSRVSSLMRNLDESEWFEDPNLTKVVANTNWGEQGNDFVLAVDIQTPEDEEEQE